MEQSNLKIRVGIFSLSMLSMATLIMSPVLGAIVGAFPNEGINQVQMILSVANLTGIVAAFIVGRLALSIDKRTIAIFGATATCILGLIPYFFHSNLIILIICAGGVGVSVGFITNVIPGLIATYFPVTQRQEAMGKQVSFVSIGTMLLMFVSGNLGGIVWYNAYLTYIFAGAVAIIAFVCLPKQAVIVQQAGTKKSNLSAVVNRNLLFVAFMGCFFMIVNNAFNNNISLLITEEAIGNSGTAGMVTMIAQLGGLLTGLIVGLLAKYLRDQMVMLAFVVEGVGLLLLSVTGNLSMALIGSFLSGAGQALFFSQAPFLVTIIVSPMLIPMGMAVLSTANSFGGFVSPNLINWINQVIGNGNAQGAMFVGAVISFAIALIAGISRFQKRCLDKTAQVQQPVKG